MQIGILQTGASPEALRADHGDYPDFFETLLAGRGLTFRTYHVEAMEFPADVRDCDGWLITGSRHGAYEDHPFIPPLEEFVRKSYGAKVPVDGAGVSNLRIGDVVPVRVTGHADGVLEAVALAADDRKA